MSIDLTRHEVRRLLDSVLGSDGAFDAFCSDFFPERFKKFSRGMNREEKTTLLLEEEEIERVVAELHEAHPEATAKYLGVAAPEAASRAKPAPRYANAKTRALSEELQAAIARKKELERAGASTEEVDRQMLELRRELREGGQLREGDPLAEGRYLLLEPVGKGGFAVVWKAHDTVRDAIVAIKVLHSSLAGDATRRERFFRGARTMASLDHPAIVKVLDPEGEDDGFHFFVMEYVDGEDLQRAVIQGHLPKDEVLRVVLQVGDALSLAHERGFVHRDVKPANILLDQWRLPKLTDFDLVAADDTAGGTRTGAMGTLRYAAPECLDKPQDADPRADVYGLGMTAVFGLHGAELPATVLKDPEQVIDGLGCEAGIKDVLKRALDWDREKRFADARTFCAELRARSEARSFGRSVLRAWASWPDPPGAQWVGKPAAWILLILGCVVAAIISVARESTRDEPTIPDPATTTSEPSASTAPLPNSVLSASAWPAPAASTGATSGPPVSTATPPSSPASASAVVPMGAVLPNGCLEGMARIPGGTFKMGSNDGLFDDEKPVHAVTVATFCLDLTEVTADAYLACVKLKQCTEGQINGSTSCTYHVAGKGNHPINCVIWDQSVAYCNARGKRLPTEEEWEYAARGGNKQRKYSWGDTDPLNQLCWKSSGTCEVGTHRRGDSSWGAHDMTGNVWEWTASSYCAYPPEGVSNNCSDTRRVLRGGSWAFDPASWLRATIRVPREPAFRDDEVGFRCAMTPVAVGKTVLP